MDQLTLRRMLDEPSEASFRHLYDEYTPRMLRFVCRLLGPGGAQAEDVVQETWLRAMDKIASFDGRSELGTWLHGIARNVTRETLRQRDFGHQSVTGYERTLVERGPDHEGRLDLERAIHRLPEGQRFILVLHDLEGYRHDEIANELDISTGTSKSQLHDARKKLVRMLEGGSR